MAEAGAAAARVARYGAVLLFLACEVGPNEPSRTPVPVATSADLRDVVATLAHDSLRGRRASSNEERLATDYVATLVGGYGLVPAAAGSFFHAVPGEWRSIDSGHLVIREDSLTLWTDFVPVLPRTSRPSLSWDAEAVYAGTFVGVAEPMPAGLDVTGKAVVMAVPAGGPVLVSLAPENPLAKAAVVLLASAGPIGGDVVALAQAKRMLSGAARRSVLPAPVVLMISAAVAERLMGQPLAGMPVGQPGGRARGDVYVFAEGAPMRNVVAVLPGSDAALADEYVVLGAHLDHIGVRQGADPTDSIYNGADDNASGSAALLMLARHFAQRPTRPRRSLAFIWFAAEELGLFGSEAFSHAPSLPLASMSAFINLDMVSRGGAADIAGGGPDYVQSIGSRRRSTLLAPLVDSVAVAHGMQLDYSFDAAGHEQRVFCRSDQWNFARFGVPVLFLTTGVHEDYHAVNDEVERSDFEKLARVTTLVGGVVDALSSRGGTLPRDLPAPDPNAACQQ